MVNGAREDAKFSDVIVVWSCVIAAAKLTHQLQDGSVQIPQAEPRERDRYVSDSPGQCDLGSSRL